LVAVIACFEVKDLDPQLIIPVVCKKI